MDVGFQAWVWRLARRGKGLRTEQMSRPRADWRVVASADPSEPLWLVPAYQRRQRSGDRLWSR